MESEREFQAPVTWSDSARSVYEELDPMEIVDRMRETYKLGALGAIGMGVAVAALHIYKEHGVALSVMAGTTQFLYTGVMTTVLVPFYEGPANYYKERFSTAAITIPVLVPFSLNVVMNTATHWAAGTPELVGSVVAASTASLLALSSLHIARRIRNRVNSVLDEIIL